MQLARTVVSWILTCGMSSVLAQEAPRAAVTSPQPPPPAAAAANSQMSDRELRALLKAQTEALETLIGKVDALQERVARLEAKVKP